MQRNGYLIFQLLYQLINIKYQKQKQNQKFGFFDQCSVNQKIAEMTRIQNFWLIR